MPRSAGTSSDPMWHFNWTQWGEFLFVHRLHPPFKTLSGASLTGRKRPHREPFMIRHCGLLLNECLHRDYLSVQAMFHTVPSPSPHPNHPAGTKQRLSTKQESSFWTLEIAVWQKHPISRAPVSLLSHGLQKGMKLVLDLLPWELSSC